MYNLYPFPRVITLKGGKQNKHCIMLPMVILPVEIIMTNIMVHNMDYRMILIHMLIYQSHICVPRMMQNSNQPKCGLIWVYFNLIVEQPTNGYLVGRTPCYTLFDTGASKASLNKMYYDEHPKFHPCPKYPINVQPIHIANDQLTTVKEPFNFFLFPLEVIPLRF